MSQRSNLVADRGCLESEINETSSDYFHLWRHNRTMFGYLELGEIVEEEHLVAYPFHSDSSLNDSFIIPAFLTPSIDNEIDNMNRKTITLDEDIIDVLNRKRLGGETWNDFFRRIVNYIPERNNRERGVKND